MTLLELLAAMAIGALVMSGTVGLIFHEYLGTEAAKASVTAAQEIGNASRWISQDGVMAESTDLVEGVPPTDQLTLTWIERYDSANIPHSSSYSLVDGQLRRNYDGTETTVAREISEVGFSQAGDLLTVSLSFASRWYTSERTVQKTYRIYLRAAGGG
jgi:hypothetical protein